jgi:integrase
VTNARKAKGLTTAAIRDAKPADKPYKLADARSLYLYITPAGNKVWRFRYIYQGRERTLVFGPWPDISLAQAREALTAAKALLRQGRDPIIEKRLAAPLAAGSAATGETFRFWAQDWQRVKAPHWTARYAKVVGQQMVNYVYKDLGDLPIARIKAKTILPVIRAIEPEAPWTALAVRQHISCVFQHAAAPMELEYDPAALLAASCVQPVARPHPAAETLPDARGVLAAVEAVTTVHPVTLLAHRLLVLTMLRTAELRGARWAEFSGLGGDAPLWTIPAARMKGKKHHKRVHVVPLSPQAVEVLTVARTLHRDQTWVFPGPKQRQDAHGQAAQPISEVAFSTLLRAAALPVPHVPHGWRASFSTLMNDRYPEDRAVIDAMLAHKGGGNTAGVSAAEGRYNRAQHHDRRRTLACAWADLILADTVDAWSLAGLTPPAATIMPLVNAA